MDIRELRGLLLKRLYIELQIFKDSRLRQERQQYRQKLDRMGKSVITAMIVFLSIPFSITETGKFLHL